MLRQLFINAARRYAWEPTILVTVGEDDNLARGDIHGRDGVAREVTRTLGGKTVRLDKDVLSGLYPQAESLCQKIIRYVEDNGWPDMALLAEGNLDFEAKFREKGTFLPRYSWNEKMSQYYGDQSLVAHHLTPDTLQAEGVEFRNRYPGLSDPLIAVIMVTVEEIDRFAGIVAKSCANYRAPTLFISTSPRTEKENFEALMEALRVRLGQAVCGGAVLRGYNLNEERIKKTFNPYAGLLDQADHIVIAGSSDSLFSEALATGKTIHIYNDMPVHKHTEQRLSRRKLAKLFNEANASFETRKIPPVNVTQAVANGLSKDLAVFMLKQKCLGRGPNQAR